MFKYNNQNRDTKIYYINLMGEIGDKNSIEHLIHILKDIKSNEKYDREILISTIKALGKIGDERATDIIHDLYFRFCRSQSDRYLTELFMDVIINVDRNGSVKYLSLWLLQNLKYKSCIISVALSSPILPSALIVEINISRSLFHCFLYLLKCVLNVRLNFYLLFPP